MNFNNKQEYHNVNYSFINIHDNTVCIIYMYIYIYMGSQKSSDQNMF